MLAFELVKDKNPNKPDTELATKLVQLCAERGLLIITAGAFGNAIRVLSPLVIEDELLNKGLDILENALAELLA